MIKNWLVRGDTHGNFLWMPDALDGYTPEETAIIILGDAGFDFYLNKSDERKKKEVNARGFHIYFLRGNHEARPQNISSYEKIYDEEVNGMVYCDPRFPNIRAFLDYGLYRIKDYTCLVIGGAYSVDKAWRLSRVGLTEENNDPSLSGWFNNEQLTKDEMKDCMNMIDNFISQDDNVIDFVFTHTCPKSFQPTDLFLSFIDQSKVDTSMEDFLEVVSQRITWMHWLFGHYHADRIEKPFVEQYYKDIESLDNIVERWDKYALTSELDWWLVKSPNFLK